MWVKEGKNWTLNPIESVLKKWLPALTDAQSFSFRNECEVEWAHMWPTGKTNDSKIIYFIRNPLDAFFSHYRRASLDVTFREFLHCPDSQTLLNKIDTWNLFNEVWLMQPNLMVFRFEDYKMDALATLRAVLKFADISATESDIIYAVAHSSFEQAAAAEQSYLDAHPEDTQRINNAGQVGIWKDLNSTAEVSEITKRCGRLMSHFGYLPKSDCNPTLFSYLPHCKLLPFYKTLSIPADFWNRENDGLEQERVIATVTMAMKMTVADSELEKYRLPPYERRQLINGLQMFLYAFTKAVTKQLSVLQAESSTIWMLLWRINRFLVIYRLRIPPLVKVGIWKLRRVIRSLY